MNPEQPFIVTLNLELDLAKTLDALRKEHFPKERNYKECNYLDTHVTLFHTLPSDQETMLRRDLEDICGETPPFGVVFPELKSWGKGVFAPLESSDLLNLRKKLAERWQDDLTPQDRQGYKPHVTVQNKVPKEEARVLYDALSPEWQPLTGGALGLSLWRYAGGPWTFAESFAFSG